MNIVLENGNIIQVKGFYIMSETMDWISFYDWANNPDMDNPKIKIRWDIIKSIEFEK